MSTKKMNLRFGVVAAMILLAAFSRVIPHMPNFSPLGAIGIFGAAYFRQRGQAFLIPIAATWLSDLFINNVIYARYYPNFTWFYEGFYWQYSSYLLIAGMSILVLKKVKPSRIAFTALLSTTLFFLISNLGCWLGNSYYPQTMSGLMTCYAAGIPFLKGTVLGDLFYTFALFGTFAIAQKQFPVLRAAYADQPG